MAAKNEHELILKIYPFLDNRERNDYIERSDHVFKHARQRHLSQKNQIEKLLGLLRNPHAKIFPKKIGKRKINPCLKPKYYIKNNVLFIIIPSWDNRLKNIDQEIIKFCVAKKNEYAGIIIDVRKNRGGDSRIAHNIAGIFFDKDVVFGKFVQRNKVGKLISKSYKLYKNGKIYIDKPIVILISKKNISSNELFLAPFKIIGRAVLVGERTEGGSANPLWRMIKLGKKQYNVAIPRWRFFLKGEKQPIEETAIKPDIQYKGKNIYTVAQKILLKDNKSYVTQKNSKRC